MLILGQTSSCYLCCANMVVIVSLDIVVPVFWEDNDTRGDNPRVECYWLWLGISFKWNLFVFMSPPPPTESSTSGRRLGLSQRDVRPHTQGLIVNVNVSITPRRPDHWNSLRAVLIRARVGPCRPISHFLKVVPFCPFYLGTNHAFFLQDQMFSISLGICHGNQ